MKTSSAKAKGRRLQQLVRDALRSIGRKHGLEDGDIESRGMGQSGVDVIFSPAAQRLFPFSIECKNVEKLNVPTTFQQHYEKYRNNDSLVLLVHSRNRTEPMVTMRFVDFIELISRETILGRESKPDANPA